MIDLIAEYMNKLEQNIDKFECLEFALKLPSICSRIEFKKTPENTGKETSSLYKPNGKPNDKNLYIKWIKRHINEFTSIFCTGQITPEVFCDKIYELRCNLVHTGVIMKENSYFYFIEDTDELPMIIYNKAFISISWLCRHMYKAAEDSIHNNKDKYNISVFKDITISNDVYKDICKDVELEFRKFWDNYSDTDSELNSIYDAVIFNNTAQKNKMDSFFKKYPDNNFEIWDFMIKYKVFLGTEHFIKYKYDESKSLMSKRWHKDSDVLTLSKDSYERMLQVHEEVEKENKRVSSLLNINKYKEKTKNN